jgi:hypothetical protein
MASFKDLKNNLTGKKPEPKVWEEKEETPNNPTFEYEEARYLLNLVAQNDFKGQDVQVVYNIALKLQTIIKNTKE